MVSKISSLCELWCEANALADIKVKDNTVIEINLVKDTFINAPYFAGEKIANSSNVWFVKILAVTPIAT
jgi:hypothetical protein